MTTAHAAPIRTAVLIAALLHAMAAAETSGDLPTPWEVECLHLVNRFRADPVGEGRRLMHGGRLGYPGSPAGIDLQACREELSTLKPADPLVMDLRLLASARSHAAWLIANKQYAHAETPGSPGFTGADPFSRIAASGFAGLPGGENCFAGAVSPWNAVSGYVIDWGAGEGNLLPGRPHRRILLSNGFDLAGTAMVRRESGMASVQNFGRSRGGRWIGGVVYVDRNRNGRFDAGEGSGGASIHAMTSATVSWPSGGWALELPSAGTGDLVFELGERRETVPIAAGRSALVIDWQMPEDGDASLLDRIEAAARIAGPAGRIGRINAAAALDRFHAPRARMQAIAALCAEERAALVSDQEQVRDAVWWSERDAAAAAITKIANRWQGSDAAAWFSGAGAFSRVFADSISYMEQVRSGRPMLATAQPALRREVAQLRQRLTCVEWQEACDRIDDVLATIVQRRL